MSRHPVTWLAPAPLWAHAGSGATETSLRPAILRFASDAFMDQLLGILERDPTELAGLRARPESWRTQIAPSSDLVDRVSLPRIVRAARRVTAALRPQAAAGVTTAGVPPTANPTSPLTLYQPAHQRYYLIAASLVCSIPGLPDRTVVGSETEQVGFVLRRRLPSTAGNAADADVREFAFVSDDAASRWQKVSGETDDDKLVPGEELLPLFPMAFRDDAGRGRTLFTGLIPVGRRESYLSAAVERTPAALSLIQRQAARGSRPAAAPRPSKEARLAQFLLTVGEPWKNLIRSSFAVRDGLTTPSPPGLSDSEPQVARRERIFSHNLQSQMQSWLILLDFADYLSTYLPDLWQVIADSADPAPLSGRPRLRSLYDWLAGASMPAALEQALRSPSTSAALKPPASSLLDALRSIASDDVRRGLETTDRIYGAANASDTAWPGFHFLLSGLDYNIHYRSPFETASPLTPPGPDDPVEADPLAGASLAEAQLAASQVDRLSALVVRALEDALEEGLPQPPFGRQVANALRATGNDPGSFVVRCVYFNRECGPLHSPVLSAPSEAFELASFFDSNAPARPIRIALPLDTTPAGLRKYPKNTAFVISDVLCGQIQRAKGLGLGDLVRSVLPWPLHKDLDVGNAGACTDSNNNSIGMICSLSIPIITICALILLIIIVTLLDLIFRWIPYFIICFPVPRLRAKP